MITRVRIKGFRGVREGGVEGLSPISILVGPNNSGKSTVLEAIGLVGKEADPAEVAKLLLRRGGPKLDAFDHVVRDGEQEAVIEIHEEKEPRPVDWYMTISASKVPADSTDNDGKPMRGPKIKLATHVREPPGNQAPFTLSPTSTPVRRPVSHPPHELLVNDDGQESFGKATATETFASNLVDLETVREHEALEDAHSRIGKARRLDLVVRALQRAMSGLTGLVIFKSGSRFILHTVRGEERPVPAYLAGDGFKRFLALAAASLDTPGGVVLLEEPETYQHPRYLEELATLLHLAARQGTQILLSTHSMELVDFLLRAPQAEGQTYPSVHRMSLYEGKLSATTLDRELAVRVRDDLVQDLRA